MRLPRTLALILADGISPSIARWAADHERRILASGVPLDGAMLEFAAGLGIGDPGAIRVMEIGAIPLPVPGWIFRVAAGMGFPVFAPGAMALGKGIYLLPGHRRSIPHELVHVRQYEQLGGIPRFMRRYVFECLGSGYFDAELEKEAREKSVG